MGWLCVRCACSMRSARCVCVVRNVELIRGPVLCERGRGVDRWSEGAGNGLSDDFYRSSIVIDMLVEDELRWVLLHVWYHDEGLGILFSCVYEAQCDAGGTANEACRGRGMAVWRRLFRDDMALRSADVSSKYVCVLRCIRGGDASRRCARSEV